MLTTLAVDSFLDHVADPASTPEVLALRERIRGWRFYDHFRSDRDAPARRPNIGTRTPVLDHDGSDLAAVWQTIHEIGDVQALAGALDDAFPGAGVSVTEEGGRFHRRRAGSGPRGRFPIHHGARRRDGRCQRGVDLSVFPQQGIDPVPSSGR